MPVGTTDCTGNNYFSIWFFASTRIHSESYLFAIMAAYFGMWLCEDDIHLQICSLGQMQDSKDAGEDGCRTGRMQETSGAGQIRCRTGRLLDRSDAATKVCKAKKHLIWNILRQEFICCVHSDILKKAIQKHILKIYLPVIFMTKNFYKSFLYLK